MHVVVGSCPCWLVAWHFVVQCSFNKVNIKCHLRPFVTSALSPPPPVSPPPLEFPAVRLLAEAGHQEHVVIGAGGHEEDEQEIRHLPVDPRGAEDCDESILRCMSSKLFVGRPLECTFRDFLHSHAARLSRRSATA